MQKGYVILGQVLLVNRTDIRPYKDQPRKFFNKEKLQRLADSIKANGQRVPISVKKIGESNGRPKFELIDGERRWQACEIAGVEKMKAIVSLMKSEKEQFVNSVISNGCREEESPLERALAVKKLSEEYGESREEIANIYAKSVAWVGQQLAVLDLDEDVIKLMSPEIPEENRLGFSLALLLVNLPPLMQIKLAKKIHKKGLSQNQTKLLITRTTRSKGIEKAGRVRGSGEKIKAMISFFRNTVERLELELETFNFKDILKKSKLQERMRLKELVDSTFAKSESIKKIIDKTIFNIKSK